MKNKNIILIVLVLLLSMFIGICSSASFAYFNDNAEKKIDSLEIQYNAN